MRALGGPVGLMCELGEHEDCEFAECACWRDPWWCHQIVTPLPHGLLVQNPPADHHWLSDVKEMRR